MGLPDIFPLSNINPGKILEELIQTKYFSICWRYKAKVNQDELRIDIANSLAIF